MTDTAVSLGSNVGWYVSQSQLLIVLGPEHAQTIANDGFSRADVQRFVFEHARLPLRTLKLGGMWGIQDWPRWMLAVTDDDALLPQVPSPEDVIVMVAGGPGKHSAASRTAPSAAPCRGRSSRSDPRGDSRNAAWPGSSRSRGRPYHRRSVTRRPSAATSRRAPAPPAAPSRSPNSATPRTVAVRGSSSVTRPATDAGTWRSPTV